MPKMLAETEGKMFRRLVPNASVVFHKAVRVEMGKANRMFSTGKELAKKLILKGVFREIWPALAVLFATLIISAFIAEFTYVAGMKALWKVLFRFLRLLLILTLPLLLLPVVCSGLRKLFNRGADRFIQLQELKDYTVHPLKNWFLRPLQGIGLVMLIAAKLLVFLQIYTGGIVNASNILPPIQFNLWHFISGTAIAAVASLLLSTLWALDDMGIRFYNRKTKEVKMLGKYLGLLLPIFFGFYGIINLFENHGQIEAVKYIIQMAVILYPPFVALGVMHNRYIKTHGRLLLKKLNTIPLENH
jgi:hypothetical protein